jgi:hypothetical protein
MDVPMLNDDEFQLCVKARSKEMTDVLKELKNKGLENYSWIDFKTIHK